MIEALIPGIKHIIEAALDEGIAKNVLNIDTEILAVIILKGFEGILHAKPLQESKPLDIGRAKEIALNYITLLLQIPTRSL